jgi:hypothetical protein
VLDGLPGSMIASGMSPSQMYSRLSAPLTPSLFGDHVAVLIVIIDRGAWVPALLTTRTTSCPSAL